MYNISNNFQWPNIDKTERQNILSLLFGSAKIYIFDDQFLCCEQQQHKKDVYHVYIVCDFFLLLFGIEFNWMDCDLTEPNAQDGSEYTHNIK